MRKFISATILGLLFLFQTETKRLAAETPEAVTAIEAAMKLLDGSKFRSQSFQGESPGLSEDTLVFKNGHFASENCREFGFSDTPYWLRVVNRQVHFRAESVSPTHGTMVWQGVIDGDKINGTFVWDKKRWYWNIRQQYRFEGERQP